LNFLFKEGRRFWYRKNGRYFKTFRKKRLSSAMLEENGIGQAKYIRQMGLACVVHPWRIL